MFTGVHMARCLKAFAGFVLLLGLAACSPDPDPYLALTMAGDRPKVLVAECARDQLSYVIVEVSTRASAPPDPAIWSVESPLRPVDPDSPDGVKVATTGAPDKITFFDVPPGWVIRQD